MTAGEKPAVVVALRGWDLSQWLPRLRAALPGRDVVVAETAQGATSGSRADSWPATRADVQPVPLPERYYLFCWKPDPSLLRRRPAPLLILSAGAGVDHILDHDPPEGVPITRIVKPDLTGRMVEYVVLHCLYHLRHMDEAGANQRRRLWRGRPFAAAREVTVGLMGIGEMGQASATGLMALGFKVIGWGRTDRGALPFRCYAGAGELNEFLGETNILLSLLPSTPATRGLIDGAKLRRLKRSSPFGGPVFINAGRGDGVNEAELVAALTDGTLRAASLDVFTTEPLPPSSPLWGMSNVVITPHNAADSDPDVIAAAVAAEIVRFETGLPLANPVDRARGY